MLATKTLSLKHLFSLEGLFRRASSINLVQEFGHREVRVCPVLAVSSHIVVGRER